MDILHDFFGIDSDHCLKVRQLEPGDKFIKPDDLYRYIRRSLVPGSGVQIFTKLAAVKPCGKEVPIAPPGYENAEFYPANSPTTSMTWTEYQVQHGGEQEYVDGELVVIRLKE